MRHTDVPNKLQKFYGRLGANELFAEKISELKLARRCADTGFRLGRNRRGD